MQEELHWDCGVWPACGTAEWRCPAVWGAGGEEGTGSNYRTESSGERSEPAVKICELSDGGSCESGQDTLESLQRESEVTGGCGQSAEESPPWKGWSGRGVQKTTDSVGCPQRLPCHLPWVSPGTGPSPLLGCQASPLPSESSSHTSNRVTKPLILFNRHPVHKTCNRHSLWRSTETSMEQFFPRRPWRFLLYAGITCPGQHQERLESH